MGLLTQQDSIGIAEGLDLYGMPNGHPINFGDPLLFGDLRKLLTAWASLRSTSRAATRSSPLEGRDAALNLQPDGSKAKAYQVKQIRQIIIEHKLASDEELK